MYLGTRVELKKGKREREAYSLEIHILVVDGIQSFRRDTLSSLHRRLSQKHLAGAAVLHHDISDRRRRVLKSNT